MYLLDTNIWLERLLDQERSREVGQFLARISPDQLLMSDFTLHSIGIVLTRLGRGDVLRRFVDDVFVEGAVALVSLEAGAMSDVVRVMEQFKLDFDDAYQYVLSERLDAVIVSFDADFDRTRRGRRTPADVLGEEGATAS